MTSFLDPDFTGLIVAAANYGTARRRRHERLVAEGKAITCPACFATSHNPNDVREGYCGNCHAWTSLPAGSQPVTRHNAHHCAVCIAAGWRDLDGAAVFVCERKGTWTLRHANATAGLGDDGPGWYLYGPDVTAMFIDTDVERALHMTSEYILFAVRRTAVIRVPTADVDGEHSGHQIR